MKALVYFALVIVGLLSWAAAIYLVGTVGSAVVHALVTWPIVRFAASVFVVGFGLFLVSEQMHEIAEARREQ